MSALEIRLLLYALVLLTTVGGAGYGGYRLAARHYEAIIEHDKQASAAALATAQQQVIADQQRAAKAVQDAESLNEQLATNAHSSAATLGDIVRKYDALRGGLLSAPPAAPAQLNAAAAGAGGDPILERLSADAAEECLKDDARLEAIQQYEREQASGSPPPAAAALF